MKISSSLLFSLVLLLVATDMKAQGENNYWCYGAHTGINFNLQPPVQFQTPMDTHEGSAAVSDANGQLLFYSNAGVVYNRNHTIMPSSYGILGNGPALPTIPYMSGSAAQGVTIVQSFSNANQYYLFTLDDYTGPGTLRYSVVDMSLDNGLGDVLPTQKNITLDTDFSESMVVMQGADCSEQWLVTRKRTSALFYAYRINTAGPSSNAVVSGAPGTNAIMAAAPEVDMMVSRGNGVLYLNKFDRSTGTVSAFASLDVAGLGSVIATAFSPQAKRLYAAMANSLLQFNLELLPSVPAVNASRITIVQDKIASMRTAPNQKLMLGRLFSNTLACLHNPEAIGAATNLDTNYLPLIPFNNMPVMKLQLGAHFVPHLRDTIAGTTYDTAICEGLTAVLQAPSGFSVYKWSDGSAIQAIAVSQPGTYWVQYTDVCTVGTDTFQVRYKNLPVDLGSDTAICPGHSVVLRPQPEVAGAGYTWNDGSLAPELSISVPGSYWVRRIADDCISSDTIHITNLDFHARVLSPDTVVCANAIIRLEAEASNGLHRWSTGASGLNTEAGAGLHYFTLDNECGTLTDSVSVQSIDCRCQPFVPNTFSPNADGKNDVFAPILSCVPGEYMFSVYNRYGQRVFFTQQYQEAWNGTMAGQPATPGAYFYHCVFKTAQGISQSLKGDVLLLR